MSLLPAAHRHTGGRKQVDIGGEPLSGGAPPFLTMSLLLLAKGTSGTLMKLTLLPSLIFFLLLLGSYMEDQNITQLRVWGSWKDSCSEENLGKLRSCTPATLSTVDSTVYS